MHCTPEQRLQALDRAEAVGYAQACEELGVNVNTMRSWASRLGRKITTTPIGQTAAAVEARLGSVAERKARLAEDLLSDAQRLRVSLWAPCVERKAMVAGTIREVEIVDIDLTQPSFVDQRAIMTSIAIAVDKVQILTGEATERIETLTSQPPQDRARAIVDELERRRRDKGVA